ncbi:MAG: hypothetical protein E6Q67_08190 [Roseateles sp.]|nr:MAG: hypothetical protein E6Q67_08190 [Roseateles sp.]
MAVLFNISRFADLRETVTERTLGSLLLVLLMGKMANATGGAPACFALCWHAMKLPDRAVARFHCARCFATSFAVTTPVLPLKWPMT